MNDLLVYKNFSRGANANFIKKYHFKIVLKASSKRVQSVMGIVDFTI